MNTLAASLSILTQQGVMLYLLRGVAFTCIISVLGVILGLIVGSLLGETVCKVCHITDPLAKGLALGTSAHAIGTSKALQMGEVEGAMSGVSIAVAGVLTAVLCPVFVSLID